MTLSPTMLEALNQQINAEMYSSHLYLAMAAYFESIDLSGFAGWMQVQAKEELLHVERLLGYLNERNGRVRLEAIDRPPFEWNGPLAVFTAALEHEQSVTAMIHQLAETARAEQDPATENLLRWYIDEQVEEEASVDRIVKSIKLGGGDPVATLLLDRELGARTLPAPAAPE